MTNKNQAPQAISFAGPTAFPSLTHAITTLQTSFEGAHKALYETLQDIYATHHFYSVNVTAEERAKNRVVLDEACKAAEIGTTPQTTDLHKLVKLVVKTNSQLTSGYVHVFSVASALQKTPDEFLSWLSAAGGIEAVRKKFRADGKPNPNYESGSKRGKNRADKIASARNALQATRCVIAASALANASFEPVKEPTECVAIVVRNPDGSIGVKGFVSKKSVLESAYLEHAVEQAETETPSTAAPQEHSSADERANVAGNEAIETAHTDDLDADTKRIIAADQQAKIAEMLDDPDDITISKIRNTLGNEIADRTADAVRQVKKMREDVNAVPSELQHYLSLLKSADSVANTSSGKSHDWRYEQALEELGQVLEAHPLLADYLDRPFDAEINPNQEDIPRLKSSRSQFAKGSSAMITSQDAVRHALRHELESLCGLDGADVKAAAITLANGMRSVRTYTAHA
ncbi:hypothetical protein J2801_002499 [Paraburkholderia phenoliruptrix]|uniref:hypothetical protein n=1 Tax=Paraburkholderia phenoliruptrix TaxID=252970 RepID=UPI00285F1F5A|nr:hypothetical protein [Paraburkholderia phenoliruptrix]MDR6420248.1 hypothetical protein [Paraburkholderia phenoliruptrix]